MTAATSSRRGFLAAVAASGAALVLGVLPGAATAPPAPAEPRPLTPEQAETLRREEAIAYRELRRRTAHRLGRRFVELEDAWLRQSAHFVALAIVCGVIGMTREEIRELWIAFHAEVLHPAIALKAGPGTAGYLGAVRHPPVPVREITGRFPVFAHLGGLS